MNPDAATSRNIRIGKVSIGLIGLDQAINEALRQGLSEAEAMDFLYRQIEKKNYIPTPMREQYRLALFREYSKHLHGETSTAETLVIRIFGPGCVSCNSLQNLVIEVVSAMNIPADIEQIHDPDEIGRAGILQTPALMINDRLRSIGLLPTRAQVEAWIRACHE
jgi:hypothetical protein